MSDIKDLNNEELEEVAIEENSNGPQKPHATLSCRHFSTAQRQGECTSDRKGRYLNCRLCEFYNV